MGIITQLFNIPEVYRKFSNAIGGTTSLQVYMDRYIAPAPNSILLDIGCGPGRLLDALTSEVRYVGVDINPKDIAWAKKYYGDRPNVEFRCERADALSSNGIEFDIVVANGVLHHLNDSECQALARYVSGVLKPGGKLVTLDGVFHQAQSVSARVMLHLDRGKFVRTQPQYEALVAPFFDSVDCFLRTDMLRIPYSHLIMIGHKSKRTSEY